MSGRPEVHTLERYTRAIGAVQDTLYVLNDKWKLPIIIALEAGPRRFKDLQRALAEITPKYAPRSSRSRSRMNLQPVRSMARHR